MLWLYSKPLSQRWASRERLHVCTRAVWHSTTRLSNWPIRFKAESDASWLKLLGRFGHLGSCSPGAGRAPRPDLNSLQLLLQLARAEYIILPTGVRLLCPSGTRPEGRGSQGLNLDLVGRDTYTLDGEEKIRRGFSSQPGQDACLGGIDGGKQQRS
ncbi:hypothetical protein SprV_0602136200 [Sparganum proliferum]